MHALILVDLQNDFVTGGALAVPDGEDVIDFANRLMPDYNLVVATQDWHPANHGSFASQHPGVSVGDTFDLAGLPQIAWPDHCVQQTSGAEFVNGLDLVKIDEIVRKGTDSSIDSYSGFFDNGHRKPTGLATLLRTHAVDEVSVMGLATDYCVKFTAIDAIEQGFETNLIQAGCRGVELNLGDIEMALEEMKSMGVNILPE